MEKGDGFFNLYSAVLKRFFFISIVFLEIKKFPLAKASVHKQQRQRV